MRAEREHFESATRHIDYTEKLSARMRSSCWSVDLVIEHNTETNDDFARPYGAYNVVFDM